jgi:uncharacterized protein YdhG (YjbR/CyaY superfamily)
MAEKKSGSAFSAEEKAAMKAAVAEAKRAKRADAAAADAAAVDEAIAAMSPEDRALAKKVHEIVRSVAPDLTPRTFYGMPAYAKDGKVVVFFQSGGKFKERYSTLGFQGAAQLDDGNLWPTSFAVTAIGAAEEKRIRELVKRAAGV